MMLTLRCKKLNDFFLKYVDSYLSLNNQMDNNSIFFVFEKNLDRKNLGESYLYSFYRFIDTIECYYFAKNFNDFDIFTIFFMLEAILSEELKDILLGFDKKLKNLISLNEYNETLLVKLTVDFMFNTFNITNLNNLINFTIDELDCKNLLTKERLENFINIFLTEYDLFDIFCEKFLFYLKVNAEKNNITHIDYFNLLICLFENISEDDFRQELFVHLINEKKINCEYFFHGGIAVILIKKDYTLNNILFLDVNRLLLDFFFLYPVINDKNKANLYYDAFIFLMQNQKKMQDCRNNLNLVNNLYNYIFIVNKDAKTFCVFLDFFNFQFIQRFLYKKNFFEDLYFNDYSKEFCKNLLQGNLREDLKSVFISNFIELNGYEFINYNDEAYLKHDIFLKQNSLFLRKFLEQGFVFGIENILNAVLKFTSINDLELINLFFDRHKKLIVDNMFYIENIFMVAVYKNNTSFIYGLINIFAERKKVINNYFLSVPKYIYMISNYLVKEFFLLSYYAVYSNNIKIATKTIGLLLRSNYLALVSFYLFLFDEKSLNIIVNKNFKLFCKFGNLQLIDFVCAYVNVGFLQNNFLSCLMANTSYRKEIYLLLLDKGIISEDLEKIIYDLYKYSSVDLDINFFYLVIANICQIKNNISLDGIEVTKKLLIRLCDFGHYDFIACLLPKLAGHKLDLLLCIQGKINNYISDSCLRNSETIQSFFKKIEETAIEDKSLNTFLSQYEKFRSHR